MRFFICVIFLNCYLAFSQSEKITIDMEKLRSDISGKPESTARVDSTYTNFYIIGSDTFWFPDHSSVIRCNPMVSVYPYHNSCSFYINGELANTEIRMVSGNRNSKREYSGSLKNGLYFNGRSCCENDGIPFFTGNYSNNRKSGFWTYHFPDGTIQHLEKYIEGVDYPVKEWEYDETGRLINYDDHSEEKPFLNN